MLDEEGKRTGEYINEENLSLHCRDGRPLHIGIIVHVAVFPARRSGQDIVIVFFQSIGAYVIIGGKTDQVGARSGWTCRKSGHILRLTVRLQDTVCLPKDLGLIRSNIGINGGN